MLGILAILLVLVLIRMVGICYEWNFPTMNTSYFFTFLSYILGDMIVYSGDVGREMYIMRRGLVEVLSKDQSYVVATLGPGGYFGEVRLIIKH